MKKILNSFLIIAVILAASLSLTVSVRADNDIYSGDYRALIWYNYEGPQDGITVPQHGRFDAMGSIAFQYGDTIIRRDMELRRENVKNPATGQFEWQEYYDIPHYFPLDNGWPNGKKIKLIDIPVPGGYELCFSGQPVFEFGKGRFKSQEALDKNVDICIPIRKKDEKTDVSKNAAVYPSFILDDGSRVYKYTGKKICPPVTVAIEGIPLIEGQDYTISYENNVDLGTAYVVVNGKGTFTGKTKSLFSICSYGTVITGNNDKSDINQDNGADADNEIKPGKQFSEGDLKYKCVNVSGKTVTATVTGLSDRNAETVNIPDTIASGGFKIKPTSIAGKAFQKTKIKKVNIGRNVKTIGANAFYGCTALKKVTIPTKVNKIGKSAFRGCRRLRTITIKTTKLKAKTVGANAFKGIHKKAVIKSPKSKKKAYKKILLKKGMKKTMTFK